MYNNVIGPYHSYCQPVIKHLLSSLILTFLLAWREPCYVVATALYGSGNRESEVGINILVYTRSPGQHRWTTKAAGVSSDIWLCCAVSLTRDSDDIPDRK